MFLRHPVSDWDAFPSYVHFKKVVKTLKVVNDVAERGVRLMKN